MKEIYTAPEMEIVEFEAEDVITTSFTGKGTLGDMSGDGDIQIP